MNCPKIRIRSASIKCQEWKILPLSQICPCMKSEICSKCYLGHKSQPTNGGENHQNMQESAHKKNRQGLKMEECKQKSPKHAKNCLPQNSAPTNFAQVWKNLPSTKFAQVWKNLPLKEIRLHGEEKMICENEMGRRLPLQPISFPP